MTNRKYFINAAIQNDLPSFVTAKPAERVEAISVHCVNVVKRGRRWWL